MTVIGGLAPGTGTPDGVAVASMRLIGTARMNDFRFAFVTVKDTSGKVSLWCKWFFGTWQPWLNLTNARVTPAPPGIDFDQTYQGSAVLIGATIFVFVRGTDGNLWCQCFNGATWDWVNINSISYGASSIAAVDWFSPGGVMVKTTAGAYMMAAWNGALWVWAAAPAGSSFVGKTTNEMLCTVDGYRALRFQVDSKPQLVYTLAADNAVHSSGLLNIKVTTGFSNPKFAVRGRNPSGIQVETEYSVTYDAAVNVKGVKFDLRNFPQFENGADCWIACVPDSDSAAFSRNESGSNFTYDKTSSTSCAHYVVSTKTSTATFVTYSDVGVGQILP